ncbi:hypothetical protein [Haloarcula sp. CBA1127]|uniref:hypothetical protein n=1 Tax=Haloarcula sp. CBA1127 TaxID=1765055 RepID=UPI001E5E1897|nr:hypothetical protein [Haloarcula sp. CBA1127]
MPRFRERGHGLTDTDVADDIAVLRVEDLRARNADTLIPGDLFVSRRNTALHSGIERHRFGAGAGGVDGERRSEDQCTENYRE